MATLEADIIKPQLRFECYQDSWKIISLSELLDFKNGVNASKADYGSGYKFINVLDIIDNDFITHDNIKGYVNIDARTFGKNIVEHGDILFQRSSETREEVGQSNVYLDKINPATFGGFVIRGKKIAEYNPFFLHLALKTPKARKEITSKSGGSTRYNVGQNTLSEVKVILPGIPEQQKISSFLTAIDKRINLLEQKKTKLEDYKKGIMQQIFSQEIRFKPRLEELNLPPGTVADLAADFPDWKERTFEEVYTTYTTNSFSRADLNLEDGEIRNIHYGDVHTRLDLLFDIEKQELPFINPSIDLSRISDENYCKEGDLILADASEDYNDIGKAIELKSIRKTKMVAGLHTILARPNKHIVALGFSGYLFKSEYVRLQIKKIAQGTKVLGLSVKQLNIIRIQLPCIEEQTKIVSFLSSIDQKIALVEKQIKESKEFKEGLLQQMFV